MNSSSTSAKSNRKSRKSRKSSNSAFNLERCQYRTLTGRQCASRVFDKASAFCLRHASAPPRDTEDLAEPLLQRSCCFQNALGINQAVASLYILLSSGRISPRRAAVLSNMAGLLLRTLPAMDKDDHPEAGRPKGVRFSLVTPENIFSSPILKVPAEPAAEAVEKSQEPPEPPASANASPEPQPAIPPTATTAPAAALPSDLPVALNTPVPAVPPPPSPEAESSEPLSAEPPFAEPSFAESQLAEAQLPACTDSASPQASDPPPPPSPQRTERPLCSTRIGPGTTKLPDTRVEFAHEVYKRLGWGPLPQPPSSQPPPRNPYTGAPSANGSPTAPPFELPRKLSCRPRRNPWFHHRG